MSKTYYGTFSLARQILLPHLAVEVENKTLLAKQSLSQNDSFQLQHLQKRKLVAPISVWYCQGQGSRFKSSILNVSFEFSREYFSAVCLFLTICLMLFLFSNSGFPSHFCYGFLSGLTTASFHGLSYNSKIQKDAWMVCLTLYTFLVP